MNITTILIIIAIASLLLIVYFWLYFTGTIKYGAAVDRDGAGELLRSWASSPTGANKLIVRSKKFELLFSSIRRGGVVEILKEKSESSIEIFDIIIEEKLVNENNILKIDDIEKFVDIIFDNIGEDKIVRIAINHSIE